ncbi:hypothetical protein ACFL4V_02145, partial [Candidatus Latescibacterota bacterium]
MIHQIFENDKIADIIEGALMLNFDDKFHKEIYEIGKLEDTIGFQRSFSKIGEAVGIEEDPILTLRFMPFGEILTIIGLQIVNLFCKIDEKDIISQLIFHLREL